MKKEFLGEGTVTFNVELGKVQQVEEPTHLTDTKEPTLIRSNPEPINMPLRRSGRVPHSSDRHFSI